jgi:sugar O-acyltransferase (sialic acid O-acetyltransferase NeuD family)
MNIFVLAAGGHSGVVIDALRSRNVNPAGILESKPELWGTLIHGVRVVGSDSELDSMSPDELQLANGLGNSASRSAPGLELRQTIFEKFRSRRFRFPPIIHAQALVAPSASLDEGVQAMAGAVVQPGASIGANALLNTRSLIEHDCRVGAHAHIAPGAILCGGVTIGEGSHVGAGAIVLQGRMIGRGTVIAAGAIVTANVADGETYGRPALDKQ